MKKPANARPIATLTTLSCLVAIAAGPAPAAAQAEDTSHRDSWQRVPAVLDAVGAVPGAHVADIGAGGGYFVRPLRVAVGERGRVYAVDISRSEVARLRHAVDGQGIRNVEVILGETDDPRLPWSALDGAIIVNAYHEMTEHAAMLEAIRSALRPGGRLVVVDNPAREGEATRAEQTERHRIAISLVEQELRDAAFEVVESDPDFINEASDGHEHRMWLLAARRPLRDPPIQRFPGAPEGPEGLFACPFAATAAELAQRPSPPDSAEARIGRARLKVCYSRPSLRGRVIMGDLVPFGLPWRTGANEPTVLRVDRSVVVGDVALEPGWYSLYTVPEADAWSVVVNGLADRDGMVLDAWVRSHDMGRFSVAVEDTGEPVERLTIRFEEAGDVSGALVIEWERSRVRVPVRVPGGPAAEPAM